MELTEKDTKFLLWALGHREWWLPPGYELLFFSDEKFNKARERVNMLIRKPERKESLLNAIGRLEQLAKDRTRLIHQIAAWRAAKIAGSQPPQVMFPLPRIVNDRLTIPDSDTAIDEPTLLAILKNVFNFRREDLFSEEDTGLVEVVDGKFRVVERIDDAEVVVPPVLYPGKIFIGKSVAELLASALAKRGYATEVREYKHFYMSEYYVLLRREINGKEVVFEVDLIHAKSEGKLACVVSLAGLNRASKSVLLPLSLLELSPEEFAERVASMADSFANELTPAAMKALDDLKELEKVTSSIPGLERWGDLAWAKPRRDGDDYTYILSAGWEEGKPAYRIIFHGEGCNSLTGCIRELLEMAELIKIAEEVGHVSFIKMDPSIEIYFDDVQAFAKVIQAVDNVITDKEIAEAAERIAARLSWHINIPRGYGWNVARTLATAIMLLSLSGLSEEEISSMVGEDIARLARLARVADFDPKGLKSWIPISAHIKVFDNVIIDIGDSTVSLSDFLKILGADAVAATIAEWRVMRFLTHEGAPLLGFEKQNEEEGELV